MGCVCHIRHEDRIPSYARARVRARKGLNVLSDVTNGLADEWPLRWSSHRSQLGVGNFGKLKESAMNLNQDLQIEGS